MKNNSGFSLVELIVVIAIMAILAGVAVPTYSKYIGKANDAQVLSQLDELKTGANAAAAMAGETVTKVGVKADNTIVVTFSGGASTKAVLADFFDGTISLDNTSYDDTGVILKSTGWEKAASGDF